MKGVEEGKEEEDCVVCFDPTTARTYPCAHAVCNQCMRKWDRLTCPRCRGAMAPLASDTEHVSGELVISLKIPNGGHAGLTVKTHDLGVRVTRLCPMDYGWAAGLRRNDVITKMNGISVGDASTFICAVHAMYPVEMRMHVQRHWSCEGRLRRLLCAGG